LELGKEEGKGERERREEIRNGKGDEK